MRFKTFRLLAITAGAVAVVSTGIAAQRVWQHSQEEAATEEARLAQLEADRLEMERRRAPPPQAPQPTAPTPAPALVGLLPGDQGATDPLRPFDRALIAASRRTLPGGKGKDLLSGAPQKINLYQDSGFSLPNRAKVDLDRDEKWDEKWTMEGDVVVRRLAPADDERYTLQYTLIGDARTGHWEPR